ncbi:MAG: pirin family protein [Proteobacteria bacterium]|nr:pirin family protein [Pseudomonadota bacterium]
MTTIRSITSTATSVPTREGAGVHLRRGFGFHSPEKSDPFLLFDDFRSDIPAHYLQGFPWHPHRGIETITYMLRGQVEHGDSLGNSGVISGGDVQWMTAGGGIVHQEMPKGDENGAMHGFQLWLNLPAREKMCSPRYRGITPSEIPEVRRESGAIIKIICGRIGDTVGPVTGISTDPEYLDITLPAGVSITHPTHPGYTAMTYVIGGSGRFAPDAKTECDNTTLVIFSDGDEVAVTAGSQGLRFLFMAGKPLREPIAWQGPIVMNTKEELAQAFEEYRNGTFLSPR